jgi:hypothetical protein
MRRIVSLALVVWALTGSHLSAEDEAPASPLDAAELFSIYKVVPAGTVGGRVIPPIERTFPNFPRDAWSAPHPILTLRDVEQIQFPPTPVDDPTKPPQNRIFIARLTYSEWGARRRARAEGQSKGGNFVEFHDREAVSARPVGGLSMGREAFFQFRGYLADLADLDRRLQAALKAIQEQPIQVLHAGGAQALAPGWTLQADAGKDVLHLQIAGPPQANGKPWAADARLAADAGVPWMVCWETKCCVLWAASAQELVSIHFDPSGEPIVARGEREEALRFADAPASVRREIEKVFPPRDGDPATRVGTIGGRVILAGKPAPGVSLGVFTHYDADFQDGETFAVKTDDAGRFLLPGVRAPAQVQISLNLLKWVDPNSGKPKEISGPSLCFKSHLKKDQVLEFTLGGEGQPVIGHVIDPAHPQRDWSKGQVEFVLVPPSSEKVAALRAGRFPYFADAYENFRKSEAGRAYAPDKMPLQADGTFRFERIPSAEYWIYVNPDGGAMSTRVKTLHMELLPEGKSETALDLGELKLLDHDVAPF